MLVKLWCEQCGDVQVRAEGVEVLRILEGQAFYWFRCSLCLEPQVGATRAEFVPALERAGVRVGEVPAEVEEERAGEPVGWDDLIDFHFALAAWNGPGPVVEGIAE